MDFVFPEDTVMLRDMLRRYVQKEARPLEMDYFNTGVLKPEQRTKLRRSIDQLGLWGYMAPEQFGGAGLDLVTSCVIEEELGGTFIPLEMGSVPPALYACQGEQVSRFLEPALEGSRRPIIAAREPGTQGVRPENWTTIAEPVGEEFLLNGRKILSIAPELDDFLILYAKSSGEGSVMGQTAFLLEAGSPGLSITQDGAITLTVKDCKAGSDLVLGEPGKALALAADEAPRAWILMGARYVGMVERLIEMASEHARDWISFGDALAVRPAVQRMLAEMRVEVESVRWLVYHAAWQADSQVSASGRIPAAQVRLASGEMLKRAVDRATMIFNGPGPSAQIEPQRLVRSVVPAEALELALEHARAVVANEMLKVSPD
jgi:alkylation response protein AidB-like acyl-CoA dehydrogenase